MLRRLLVLSFALGCLIGPAAAQEWTTGRTDRMRTRGGWATHRVQPIRDCDTGRTIAPRSATVIVTADPFQARFRAGVSVGVPTCEPVPAIDPFSGGRRVVVSRTIVTTGPQVAPQCEPAPVCPPQPAFQPRRITRDASCDPIPVAEPVAACPTEAPRGPAGWTGARRTIAKLPGPAHDDCNAIDPSNAALTPPPFDVLADELVNAIVACDVERACRLARWLEGRPRYAAAVEAEFFARLPSPTLLQKAARKLGRDCGNPRAQGSLVRLLGAEGSGN